MSGTKTGCRHTRTRYEPTTKVRATGPNVDEAVARRHLPMALRYRTPGIRPADARQPGGSRLSP